MQHSRVRDSNIQIQTHTRVNLARCTHTHSHASALSARGEILYSNHHGHRFPGDCFIFVKNGDLSSVKYNYCAVYGFIETRHSTSRTREPHALPLGGTVVSDIAWLEASRHGGSSNADRDVMGPTFNDAISKAPRLIPCYSVLCYWPALTLLRQCVSKLTTIGSDNGLMPGRRWAIIVNWTIRNKLQWCSIKILTFSFKKMLLQMPSVQ